MRITLIKFRDILSGNLKPWLDNIATKEQFKLRNTELPIIAPTQPIIYCLSFTKAYSPKTIYYSRLITNAATEYTNEVKSIFNENDSVNIRTSLIYSALRKEFTPLFGSISELFDEDYSSEYLDIMNLKKTTPAHKENTFILHFIKATTIQLYLEIQELGKDFLKTEYLELKDLHFQFFNESIPEFYSITKQELANTIVSKPTFVEAQKTHKKTFVPILDDIRTSKKGVASFHDLVRNPRRFGSFEEKLFQNDFINDEYSFCGKHGYKNQLAIIYHLLIEKNYFNKFNDTNKKLISSKEIIKFLNHRYDIDVDKQFRLFKTKPEERAKFTESIYWLFQLPMC